MVGAGWRGLCGRRPSGRSMKRPAMTMMQFRGAVSPGPRSPCRNSLARPTVLTACVYRVGFPQQTPTIPAGLHSWLAQTTILFGPTVALYTAPFPVFWRFTSASRTVATFGLVGLDFSNRSKSARTVAFNCMNCSASLKSLRLSWHSLNPVLHLLSPEVWRLLWGAGPATKDDAQKLRRRHARVSLFI